VLNWGMENVQISGVCIKAFFGSKLLIEVLVALLDPALQLWGR